VTARRAAASGLLAAAAVAVALPWLVGAYPVTVASYALVMAVLALSALLLNTAGLPSLGQGAYLGVGAYAAAITATRVTASGPVQLAAAVAAAVVAAAVVGAAVVRTRGLLFLLATLGVAELAQTAAEHAAITGGGNGISVPDVVPWPGAAPLRLDGYAYLYALAVFAAAAVFTVLLIRSRAGLAWRAIGDGEARAAATGYAVTWRLWWLHLAAAGIAGAAGAMLVATQHYIAPASFGYTVSAAALVAAVVGRRSAPVAVAVAVALVVVGGAFGGVFSGYGPVLLGVALVVAAISTRWRPLPAGAET
jgi:branched-chain amino acid transport system permease protein